MQVPPSMRAGKFEIPGRSKLRPGFRHRSESLPRLFCRRLAPAWRFSSRTNAPRLLIARTRLRLKSRPRERRMMALSSRDLAGGAYILSDAAQMKRQQRAESLVAQRRAADALVHVGVGAA